MVNQKGHVPFLFILFNLIIFLFFNSNIFADSLESVINKFESSNFHANFILQKEDMILNGKIYYQNGNIHIKLNDGRIIASNYKNILVYDPTTKVLGKQDKTSGGGLSWVLKFPYHIEGNKAIIEPPDGKPYSKITIIWNNDLFPTQILFQKEKSSFSFKFSNIAYVNNLPSNYFSYKPPAGSRTVENPLNLKK